MNSPDGRFVRSQFSNHGTTMNSARGELNLDTTNGLRREGSHTRLQLTTIGHPRRADSFPEVVGEALC
jgi:hypothetical protein